MKEETKLLLKKNLFQGDVFHQKSHMDCPGISNGPYRQGAIKKHSEPWYGPIWFHRLNLLKPNDIYIYIYIYICRTAALTSRRYILNIYSTNTHTEYFKHAA